MRALKVLVVILGILLIIGFSTLGVMIYRKFQEPHMTHLRGPRGIVIPASFTVVSITAVSDRVLVHLRSATKGEQIIIVNPRSGEEITRIVSAQSESK